METSLPAILQRLGRRLMAIGVTAGFAWGLVAAVILLLTGVWLDLLWELPPTYRIGCIAAAMTAGAALLVFLARVAWRRRAPRHLAQQLDRVVGSGGQILSGVDLYLEQPTTSPLSAGLAQLAVNHAGMVAHAVPGSKAVPAKPLGWSFGSLVLVGVAVALGCLLMPRLAWTQWLRFSDPYGDHEPYSRVIFHVDPGDKRVVYGSGFDIRVTTEGPPVDRLDLVLQNQNVVGDETVPMFPEPGGEWRATVANVTTPGRYWVRTHAGRSEKFRIEVITVPKIEAVRFRITQPAYTNRPPYEGPLPQEGLAGLPGTQVQVWAKSNRPLSGGQITLPGMKDGLAMSAVSAQSVEATATFTIRQAGKLQLKVTDIDGQPSNDTFTAAIVLLADERPFVRLLEPKPMSFATPDVGLPVVMAAEDDYGISRIQLFRSLNDSRAVPTEVRMKVPPPTRWTESLVLPLQNYGLTPGDEIKLYARVEDNDPAGAKGAESNVVTVRIISREDYDRMIRTQQGLEAMLARYQEAQRRIEALAEEINKLKEELDKLPPESDLAKEQQKKLDELAKEMKKQADAIRESAKHPMPYDVDKNLSKHLEELAKRIDEAAKEAGDPQEGAPKAGSTAKKLGKMAEKLAGAKKDFEKKAKEPMEHLAAAFPLLQDAARFVELYERQKDLAERLQSLKDKDKVDDPAVKARMRDLQAEQQQLRDALDKLMDDIDDHVAKLPDQPEFETLKATALEFVQGIRDSGCSGVMGDAESALGDFLGSRGYESAKKAEEIMAQFIKRGKCNGLGNCACNCLKFQPSLSECLGDSLSQMLGDMGLPGFGEGTGFNPGMGVGGGSGFSSRRSMMDNVGLYGNNPLQSPSSSGGGKRDSRTAMPGESRGGKTDRGQPSALEGPGGRAAGGPADTAVPLPYRRKTAEYFQRVADETGK